MTTDKTIYIERKIQALRSGSYTAQQTGSRENVIVHYGPISESGEDRWIAIEKMIRRLRKMRAAGLADREIVVPGKFKQFKKFIIPAQVLMQDKADPIDRGLLKKANAQDTEED